MAPALDPVLRQEFNEAVRLANEARFSEAAAALRRLLSAKPDFTEAVFALSTVLGNKMIAHARKEESAQGAECLREALCWEPDSASTSLRLAEFLIKPPTPEFGEQQRPAAIRALGWALRLAPDSERARSLLLAILSDDAAADKESVSHGEKCLLAELVLAADRTDEVAMQLLLHHAPLYCDEAFNTADFESAVATVLRAVPHARWLIDHPEKTEAKDLPELLNCLATALSLYGHSQLALDFTEIVRTLDPDNKFAHQNRMFAALYCGDFRSAWSAENWWAFNACLQTAMWDGVSKHRSIQIINNNGFGDLLQFIRFIPRIAPFFDEIYVFDRAFKSRKYRHQVGEMLKRSPGFEKVQAVGPRPEGMYSNHYCEMFALPFALHAVEKDFAVPGGYLTVPDDLISAWSGVTRKPGRLSVAFAWGTGADTDKDRRGIGLANMLDLFELDGVDFYSIQNTGARAALSRFDLPPSVTDLGIVDLDHMAAIMKSVDLVILPDCGLAHLAGAIGADLWLAAHKYCDWRWRKAGWYPTAKIFTQAEAGDWRPVIAEMRRLLAGMAAGR